MDVLSIKIPKVCLNIVWAAYIWPSKLGICKDFSLVQDNVKVQVSGFLVLSSRIQWTRSIWGKIHRFFYFLTRIQRECCKGGLEHISQKPWVDVARSRKTHPNYGRGLSRPYVSSQITVIHFQRVQRNVWENFVIKMCITVREWWRSEEEPGIATPDRINMQKHIRSRLLQ